MKIFSFKVRISTLVITALFVVLILAAVFVFPANPFSQELHVTNIEAVLSEMIKPTILPLDTFRYDANVLYLANATTTNEKKLWPASTTYPLDGAILPFRRIIAYYGNFYSKQMGVLGEYSEPELFSMLNSELQKWDAIDPEIPALPAIQYIAVTAQGHPGDDGKYRFRMPDDQIQKALDMAHAIGGILILDIQPGQSNLEAEVPPLEKWLKLPDVHLAVDPEFAMKKGQVPGAIYIGTIDASDVNFVSNYLAGLVQKYHLPPKILVVHRFTKNMVTNVQNIETMPQVQIVMNMDGWGDPQGKLATYFNYVYKNPVQFAGIKLFYKNDLRNGSVMLTPEEIMGLTPRPVYVQYQ
jgi:hypothetical protein